MTEGTNQAIRRRLGRMDQETETGRFRYLPLSVRLETAGGVATPLVPRGTPLPAKRAEVFSTAADSQPVVEASLFLGERPLAQDNALIGTFRLEGISPSPRGVPQILVEFAVDEHCTVTAVASVQGTKLRAEQAFPPPLILSPDVVAGLLVQAAAQHDADEAALQKVMAANRAGALIAQAETELARGPRSKLSEAVAVLGLALDSGDSEAIRQKSDALEAHLRPSASFDLSAFGQLFGARVAPPPQKRPSRSTVPASAIASQPSPDPYVHPDRIAQLKACKSATFDLTKLVALCEELNVASKSQLVLAVGMLVRATLDHVPPIFGCKTFSEVGNNYGGARSFKEAMRYLETTSRKIADSFLHIQVRKSEALPTRTQVDFRNALDMLLQEIVRVLH
jgi:Hsp70 protein